MTKTEQTDKEILKQIVAGTYPGTDDPCFWDLLGEITQRVVASKDQELFELLETALESAQVASFGSVVTPLKLPVEDYSEERKEQDKIDIAKIVLGQYPFGSEFSMFKTFEEIIYRAAAAKDTEMQSLCDKVCDFITLRLELKSMLKDIVG